MLVSGIIITFETAYAVITQAISVVVAPMLPLISRNDTFTTVVSISSKTAQEMAVRIKIHFSDPVGYKGFGDNKVVSNVNSFLFLRKYLTQVIADPYILLDSLLIQF